MSAFHAVPKTYQRLVLVQDSVPQHCLEPGLTKDHHKIGTNWLPACKACVRVGVSQCNMTV